MKSARFNRFKAGYLTLCTFLLTAWPSLAVAQGPKDNLSAYMQLKASDIRAKTMEIVSGSMNFTDKEGSVFWPIYKKYEYESGVITDQLIAVIKDYRANLDKIDDAQAKDLAERVLKIDEQKASLNRKFYREFSKVLPSKRVLQFFQLSRRIDLLVNLRIAATLPMIGEDW